MLPEARLQAHHAVQLNTHFARAYVEARADDSHTSLTWDPALAALVGAAAAGMRPALQIEELSLIVIDEAGRLLGSLALEGRTFEEARTWLGSQARQRGLDPEKLNAPLHFTLADHPLMHGAEFSAEPELAALSGCYARAAKLLGPLPAEWSPLRCWPHHFDIARLLDVRGDGSATVGVGMSPGDDNYVAPYWYVSPWPHPDPAGLPTLELGSWHLQGWVGTVLPALDASEEETARFLDASIAVSRRLLAS